MSHESIQDNEDSGSNPFVEALVSLARHSVMEDHVRPEDLDEDDLRDDREVEIFVSAGAIRAARRALATMGLDNDGNVAPKATQEVALSQSFVTVTLQLPRNSTQSKSIVEGFKLFEPGGYLGATCTAMGRGDLITQLERHEAKGCRLS